MIPKDLLAQLSHLEAYLNYFSYEKLSADKARELKKSFQSFKRNLFEKFSQADGSTSRKAEGTGLGLNICKTIISAHHGDIGFESEPDHGALFWFELPVTQV